MRTLVVLLAISGPAFSAEPDRLINNRPLTPQQQQFWDAFLALENLHASAVSPDYEGALLRFKNGSFVEALTAVNALVMSDPHHPRAQRLCDEIRACLRSGGIRCTMEDILRCP